MLENGGPDLLASFGPFDLEPLFITAAEFTFNATSFTSLTVPTAVGEYAFSPTISATFVLNDRNQSNLWATRGKVIVESVTEADVIARAIVE